jgi:type II secretory pathway pseudopilin PulG
MELMMVVGIIGVLSGIAVFQVGSSQQTFRGDGAMRVIVAQLNTARSLAISQRRIMLVNFLDPGVGLCGWNAACVQIVRQEIASVGGTTVLSTVPFEGGVQFNVIASIGDTPDAFGISTPKYFGGVSGGYGFTTDGTFINTTTGVPLNGTLSLSIPSTPLSFRAVTLLGATGRVRAYRWDSRVWKLV